ncbi:DUF4188 domain-containing protein [Alkalihalobacillus sp. LMS39]|uniref:DUF4188 domain-containing protein n=1 Tax=Alkalihalobacillus sp. LMS39 TaxID=2924032 RepID=UPI001FB1F8B5|nr:DUF4188 domain-containing protein [Alkalihalobacillus sp. LMS39]UOE96094.1 DUF4188 domain-containing protein [Alkalihalobacillus sp. LMS39]
MGKDIRVGRFMANPNEEVVVFIIGMRINKWWAIHKWLPVAKAMPGMIRELYSNKKYGFLSLESTMNLRTIVSIQYWSSVEQLQAYAKEPLHTKAWKNFNKKCRNNSAVGVFHETYIVSPSKYESVYVNMPIFGLGTAVGSQSVAKHYNSAAQRLEHDETT